MTDTKEIEELVAQTIFEADPDSGFNMDGARWAECGPNNVYHDIARKVIKAANIEALQARVGELEGALRATRLDKYLGPIDATLKWPRSTKDSAS